MHFFESIGELSAALKAVPLANEPFAWPFWADAAPVADALTELEAAERAKIVKTAVGELEPKERELLELAYFSDLSQAEIAEKVGVPLGTVKTRMRTALIKLRDALRRLR